MSTKRRWKASSLVVLDSSDDEVKIVEVVEPSKQAKPANQRAKEKTEAPPKRLRSAAAATSGRSQLPLQLSQQMASQPDKRPNGSGTAVDSRPSAVGKSGLAALMDSFSSRPSNLAAQGASTDGSAGAAAELWVSKHAPQSEGELVVHKKKVQEVRQWLEWQRATLGRAGIPRVALVTGPPGCGKSSVVRVLAEAVGFQPCEWTPPTPTLWNEYQLQAGSGGRYLSKLDAFEEYALRAKLPALNLSKSDPSVAVAAPSQSGGAPPALSQQSQQQQTEAAAAGEGHAVGTGSAAAASQVPKLLVVDDLPHAANIEQRERLAAALGDLARTTRFPLLVMATETSRKPQQDKGPSAAAGSYQGIHKDLVAALEAAHATTLSFNPITTITACKALKAILAKESLSLSDVQVQSVAEQAQGDLHNAISTLQFVCMGVKPSEAPAPARRGRGAKRKTGAAAAGGNVHLAGQQEQGVPFASRDATLTIFHALGKLLYNKRLGQEGGTPAVEKGKPGKRNASGGKAAARALAQPESASGGLQVADWCRRAPMDFDPEAAVEQSGLDGGSVAAYLHENLHHFVEEGAVEDAAGCLDYLSQADCIATSFRFGGGNVLLLDDELPSSTLADAAAASTAARGVCFANVHPAPRRFLPLSAPAAFQAERAVRRNREQLERGVAAAWALGEGARHLESTRGLACELLPFVRSIHGYSRDPRLLRLLPARWCRVWEGQLYDSAQGVAGQWAAGALEAGVEASVAADGGQGEDAIEDSAGEEDW